MITVRPATQAAANATNNNAALQAALPDAHPAKTGSYPWQWVLVGLLVLYAGIAWLQRRKLQQEIQWHNIIVNLHNFTIIGLSAWIFFILAKLATVKMSIATNPWVNKAGSFFKNLLPTN